MSDAKKKKEKEIYLRYLKLSVSVTVYQMMYLHIKFFLFVAQGCVQVQQALCHRAIPPAPNALLIW